MPRVPWNKGKKGVYSKETLEIMSLKKQGKKLPESQKQKMRGRKLTPENKAIAIKNLKPREKGFTGYWKGKEMPHMLGSKNPAWKGGITTYERKLWLNRRRRITQLGNGGFHTQGEWDTLKAQYNWTCPSCKKKEPLIKLTVDHIIPVSKGGSDNIENIQPLCKSCNSKKNNKLIGKVQVTDIN